MFSPVSGGPGTNSIVVVTCGSVQFFDITSGNERAQLVAFLFLFYPIRTWYNEYNTRVHMLSWTMMWTQIAVPNGRKYCCFEKIGCRTRFNYLDVVLELLIGNQN